MAGDLFDVLTAEQRARVEIDRQLVACGWVVQDYHHAAVRAAQGVAVREMPTTAGWADYVLFVDGRAVGVIEAKKAGTTLTGVEWQTRKYQTSFPHELPAFLVDEALPFGYESTGVDTRFTCGIGPRPGIKAGVHVPSARDVRPVAEGIRSPPGPVSPRATGPRCGAASGGSPS